MADRLLELSEHPASAMANWREIVKEINYEWSRARAEEQRVALLAMFNATMDLAETAIAPDDLEKFRKARLQQYNSFLVQESLVGTNVCVEMLYAITEREIAAGRMSADHSLRELAVQGMAAPHLSREELIAIAENDATAPTPRIAWWRRVLTSLLRGPK